MEACKLWKFTASCNLQPVALCMYVDEPVGIACIVDGIGVQSGRLGRRFG
jgi:hypothetical protein